MSKMLKEYVKSIDKNKFDFDKLLDKVTIAANKDEKKKKKDKKKKKK